MPIKKIGTGLTAVADAWQLADIDVTASYPIRPYTAVMAEVAKRIANGQMKCEMVHGEGEHAQFSIAHGASMAGARATTGSSGVGVTYAGEVYSPIAGGRCPIQALIGDRTLDPPGDFGSEHTDCLTLRDNGWIYGWAENAQESLDNSLMMFRIGEDPEIMLPQIVAMDGYFVTHISQEYEMPDQADVDKFLPPFKPEFRLDVNHPVIMGPQIEPEMGPPLEWDRNVVMNRVKDKIVQVTREYNKIMGRNYAPFVEEYRTDDADMVFLLQGAHAVTCRSAIRYLRDAGYKVGMCRLRWFRPFPDAALQQILPKFKVVGVIDTNTSYGAAGGGGVLLPETRASVSELTKKPLIQGFTSGLGGETITHEEFFKMADMMRQTMEAGKMIQSATWVNFNDYDKAALAVKAAWEEAASARK
ncbi:pyruvate flavodoxin/ferredoxin oxidoreductase thiamine dip-bdg [Lucifera butyrica]|uniref:Pyruvate flavodoxin/ferredoxin oxidoreductase thiamine dip-bdg n=1 Tax=Lucifera butyrica TaxID=1351585 RepID=A0A498R9I6_9FIRM|nr:pyruvate ferredoxin oxidoreductase [Lucifera butyrica]VBB07829.1 pyruvate flavodoxin/ferredoxin oxidoreductase thiamine dip-bdg [Lucifera butyrica]